MDPRRIELTAADGVRLIGHWWPAAEASPSATVVINPATGVHARYYHRYAAYLAANGFSVLTYDYRGIGLSRPESLHGSTFTGCITRGRVRLIEPASAGGATKAVL